MAAIGAALLMGSSAELSARNFTGDLLALFAGLLYTGYLIAVQRARGALQPLPLLFISSAFGAVMLLPVSLILGERLFPADWTFVLILALSSQVLGQGLLVYALGSVPPLVVGLTLLTQPAISALVGWLAYGETLSLLDWIGAIAIAAALVLVRLPAPGLRRAADQHEHDAVHVGAGVLRGSESLQAEKPGQRETERGQSARVEKIAPAQAVTEFYGPVCVEPKHE